MFDYWLRVSTLEKRHPIYVPVKLAKYHREVLEGQRLNTSVTLNRDKHGKWRLTFSYDVVKAKPTRPKDAPVVGVDIGISNFITTSTGKQYGTFKQDLADAHQRDRRKRQRKAKLRACLEKQGVEKLPSTSSATGQRLSRRVRQEINRAVNQCLDDHPDHHLVIERLNVGGMRFKARQMNAYLYASNLGHIPKHLEAKALLHGLTLTKVNPAYTSQQCSHCHYTHRDNRPNQQTFCCLKCGFTAHADVNASVNVLNRLDDRQVAGCKGLPAVKHLLDTRHKAWCQHNGYA
jgi:IS605 OrfB family transposase